MKNKKTPPENMLDKIPQVNNEINWSIDENNSVILEIKNNGLANKLVQMVFKKPEISFIHLDDIGSFIWLLIDGKKSIFTIGKEVKEHFGNKAEPLYERLAQYFKILDNYDFIVLK